MLHRVKRRGRHLSTSDEWHTYRKTMKKLRYAVQPPRLTL